MRAILRASDQTSLLWIDSGERFELPELTDPAVAEARAQAAEAEKAAKAAKAALAAKAARAAKAALAARRAVGESTGPTDEGGPGAQARLRAKPAPAPARRDVVVGDEVEDRATDEAPRSALRLLRPPAVGPVPGIAPDSLPPLGAFEPSRTDPPREASAAPARPPRRTDAPAALPPLKHELDDEMSTGLFESLFDPMAWDEADPCSIVSDSFPHPGVASGSHRRLVAEPEPPRAVTPPRAPPPAPRAPSPAPAQLGRSPAKPVAAAPPRPPTLTVVRRAEVDEDFSGIVALPLAPPPRPVGPEAALPAPRSCALVPDWYDDDRNGTRFLIDPTRPAARFGFWTCVALDLAAWAAGFVVTFVAGAAVSATAVGVAVVVG